MKKKQKGRKKRKDGKNILLLGFVTTAVFCLAVFFGFSKTLAFGGGWATGIWNNSLLQYIGGAWQVVDNPMSSPPTIGQLSSNSELSGCNGSLNQKYSVHFAGNLGDSERAIQGQAWFGIGSQPDLNSTDVNCDSNGDGTNDSDLPSSPGWLSFGEAPDTAWCSAQGIDPNICGSGHIAKWHDADSDPKNGFAGYIDGWAKIDSMMHMPKPDGTFADNGWVRIYHADVNSEGAIPDGPDFYAWNSGEENTTAGNSGLGWIKLNGLKLVECDLSCATKQLCKGEKFSDSDSNFCAGNGATFVLGSDKVSWSCSSSCGSVSCGNGNINWIDAEVGACGALNGKSICDPKQAPTSDNLCANGTTPHNFSRNAITATWTCGNSCSGGSVASCSASARCGWIETAP